MATSALVVESSTNMDRLLAATGASAVVGLTFPAISVANVSIGKTLSNITCQHGTAIVVVLNLTSVISHLMAFEPMRFRDIVLIVK